MALLDPTGPPQMLMLTGEVIDLPLPDTVDFMKGDLVDESAISVSASHLQKIVGSARNQRARFTFGYRYLDVDSAADVIRVFEEHPIFNFTPRTVAAGDPSSAEARTYLVRFTSGLPFVINPTTGLLHDVEIELEAVNEELGSGVTGQPGQIFFISQDGNAGDSGFPEDSVVPTNSLCRRNVDGTLAVLVEFGSKVPSALALSQTQSLLVVGFDDGDINTYDLAGDFVQTLTTVGNPVEDLALMDSGSTEGRCFYMEDNGGSGGKDLKYIDIALGGVPVLNSFDVGRNYAIGEWPERERILTLNSAIAAGGNNSWPAVGGSKEIHYQPTCPSGDGTFHVPALSRIYHSCGSVWYYVPDTGVNLTHTTFGTNGLEYPWYDKDAAKIYGRNGIGLRYFTTDSITLVELPFEINGVDRDSDDFGDYNVQAARVWQS